MQISACPADIPQCLDVGAHPKSGQEWSPPSRKGISYPQPLHQYWELGMDGKGAGCETVWLSFTANIAAKTRSCRIMLHNIRGIRSSARRPGRFWARHLSPLSQTTATPFWLFCLHVPFHLCTSSRLQQPGRSSTHPHSPTLYYSLQPALATAAAATQRTSMVHPYPAANGPGPPYIQDRARPYTPAHPSSALNVIHILDNRDQQAGLKTYYTPWPAWASSSPPWLWSSWRLRIQWRTGRRRGSWTTGRCPQPWHRTPGA